jgi:hypothetical protein
LKGLLFFLFSLTILNSAVAGAWSHGIHNGSVFKTYDLSVGDSPDSFSVLMFEADKDARNKCPAPLPMVRLEDYKVTHRYIPYSSFLKVSVRATYGCGEFESDY